MNIHTSTFELSEKLNRFLPIPGLVALVTYLATLAHNAYPGYPAALTAAAAGLTTPSGPDHAVYAWFLRGLAALPILSLPVRLNLFSALCGTLCVILLYHLVARLILFFACETRSAYYYGGFEGTDAEPSLPTDVFHVNLSLFRVAVADGSDETDAEPSLPNDVLRVNLSMLRVAVVGGLIASFLLLFTVPLWTGSTRAHPAAFDLLLALASLDLLLTFVTAEWLPYRPHLLALAFFLLTLGLFETAAFLPLLPCFLVFIFFNDSLSSNKIASFLGLLLAGTAGVACAWFMFFQNIPVPPSSGLMSHAVLFLSNFASHHYREALFFFPHTGWVLIVLQTAMPAALLLFGCSLMFQGGFGRAQILLALSVIAMPSLLNLPYSPWFFYQRAEHLPVFSYAVIATAAGFVIAACYKMILFPVQTPDEEDAEFYWIKRRAQIEHLFSWCLLVTLLVTGVLTPWRSFRDTDTRSSSFADEIAHDMVMDMGQRTWLISNGGLDNHLLLQANLLKHPLTLVTLRQRLLPDEFRKLDNLIANDPVFEGLNRIRLQNALSVGPVRFIMEWFKTDPQAAARAMVFATPEIWTACGYHAVPDGLAFGGIPHDTVPDFARITEQNRRFTDRVAPLLSPKKGAPGQVMALRRFLRLKAGYTANELGVYLEEKEQTEAAYQSYLRAGQIDPLNISADINAYALASSKKLHPEEMDRLLTKIKSHASDPSLKNLTLTGILQTYGTIRQPDFYRQQSSLWSNMGSTAVALDKINKASALSAEAGAQTLMDNASFYLQAGVFAKAEACCQAVLENDAANVAALTTMATLALNDRKLEAAQTWLDKAARAGADEAALLHQTIQLALFKNNESQAKQLLLKATQDNPDDVRYWFLLADVLLKQNAVQDVEFKVLPAIQKALNNQEHFLVHTVRGFILRKKGPKAYKEARLELLHALSLNANLPDVLNTVFELDLAIGNPDFMEADAKSQLMLNPDHALANYLMGTINLKRGDLQKSEDSLRRSIGARPSSPACNDLAENLRRQKRLAEAETFARQALAIEPDFPSSLDTLACILLDAQRVEAAAPLAALATQKSPSKTAFQLTLLRVRVKQNNVEEVKRLLDILVAAGVPVSDALQQEIRAMK